MAEQHLTPILLACVSSSTRIVCAALDSLQKLVAYGHLSDDASATGVGQRRSDAIVDVICDCFRGETTDAEVQLQMLKVLLTMVMSPSCEVHEAALLRVIRTCYNIYLVSKDLVNQRTAKATLTQMLNAVFQRMEAHSLLAMPPRTPDSTSLRAADPPDTAATTEPVGDASETAARLRGTGHAPPSGETERAGMPADEPALCDARDATDEEIVREVVYALVDEVVEQVRHR